ncbi:hypothetical protein FA592_05695 [Sulfurospirillum diekertiae]|uniref:hypothetical protein n=1 Tax=Sulfurospirillum diekertiae TaxID=1854492 RepID=UPI0014278387|nr:hypothetical protein [Sulfurospirillum diekertiae]QIR78393.1 hypothetical protein FA592_05695 [Sulfurospirillum diekertiae]
MRLSMKHYTLTLDNANAEVLKWLDNTANKRIHQTTLQMPFELLAQEQLQLLPVPKAYQGIHPKALIESVAKKYSPINSHKDLENYISPIETFNVTMSLYPWLQTSSFLLDFMVVHYGVRYLYR